MFLLQYYNTSSTFPQNHAQVAAVGNSKHIDAIKELDLVKHNLRLIYLLGTAGFGPF